MYKIKILVLFSLLDLTCILDINSGTRMKNPTVKLCFLCESIISLFSHLAKSLSSKFTSNDQGPSLIQDCLFVLNSVGVSVFRLEILRNQRISTEGRCTSFSFSSRRCWFSAQAPARCWVWSCWRLRGNLERNPSPPSRARFQALG